MNVYKTQHQYAGTFIINNIIYTSIYKIFYLYLQNKNELHELNIKHSAYMTITEILISK